MTWDMCFDFHEHYTQRTIIDAVTATYRVDTVLCNSEYFEDLGSGGSG